MERHISSKGDGFLLRSTSSSLVVDDSKSNATTSSQFVLQWGNRKRLRCMKVQAKDNNNNNNNNNNSKSAARSDPVRRLSTRVVKSDNSNGFGHLNLRQRPSSPAHRILRNTDTMNNNNNNNNNGVKVGLSLLSSPERGGGGAQDKKSKGNNNNNGSSETAHDSKQGGGSSSGSDTMPAVWPPKFVIGLTNKEKEEDFLAIKGVKLPHRPKKRAKYIQRTLNLVSPGAWLCDLTLERYEVRERKVTKKRPRGLKAMGNMESDSE